MTKNESQQPQYCIHAKCTGPNPACKLAHKHGRSVHIIPRHEADQPLLVLDTYHYETFADAIEEFNTAMRNAVIIHTDEQLRHARRTHQNHKLPVGGVDPTRRSAKDWANYYASLDSTP